MSNCSTCFDISIHAAREGGDPRQDTPQGKRSISIHAAREGGDDDVYARNDFALGISIHAAREGGDVQMDSTAKMIGISIHAAREGGDGIAIASAILKFQSTPPVKAATVHGTCPRYSLFQSTPPVKAATGNHIMLHHSGRLFQSTPPVKAAT